jgi:murein L,D-transpeptidase YcbB/YkuD
MHALPKVYLRARAFSHGCISRKRELAIKILEDDKTGQKKIDELIAR